MFPPRRRRCCLPPWGAPACSGDAAGGVSGRRSASDEFVPGGPPREPVRDDELLPHSQEFATVGHLSGYRRRVAHARRARR